jgi:hypothetical protein
MLMAIPYYTIDGNTMEGNEVVVEPGGSVTLGLTTPSVITASKVSWSNGTTGSKTLTLQDIQTSGEYTASFTLGSEEHHFTFNVFVKASATNVEPGNYLIQDVESRRLLTGHDKGQPVTFEEGDDKVPVEGQTWFIDTNGTRYAIVSLPDSLGLGTTARLYSGRYYSFYLDSAVGTDRYALHTGTTASSAKYWTVNADGSLLTTNNQFTMFPFRLIPISHKTEDGDVNGDGVVDVADIATIISIMAHVTVPDASPSGTADVNGDGVVDVADIASIISIMAEKSTITPRSKLTPVF